MKAAKILGVACCSVLVAGFFACGGGSDDTATPGPSGTGGVGGAGGGTGGSGAQFFDSSTGGFFETGQNGDTSPFDSADADCASTTVSATLKPANMLFAIDRSGSMNCNTPPTTTTADCEASPKQVDLSLPTKWEITRDAFKGAIDNLGAMTPIPWIGMSYFNVDNWCAASTTPDVDVMELNVAQANQLKISLDAVKPGGGTPIIAAMMYGFYYLDYNASTFTGNRFVVLLTDGGETCDPANTDFLLAKTAEAAGIGIRTFVLGAPGSETARAFLSRLAWEGGTASLPSCTHDSSPQDVGDCHMDMTQAGTDFSTALTDNLKKISGEALSCVIDVPKPEDGGPAVDPTKVNVTYTHGDHTVEALLQDNTVDCGSTANKGWQYTDTTNTKIVLCGAACNAVKADPQASVSIQLGCETKTVIPK